MTSTTAAANTAANAKQNQGTNNSQPNPSLKEKNREKKKRRDAFAIMCDKAEKLTAAQKIELITILKASLQREREALQSKLELITNQSI